MNDNTIRRRIDLLVNKALERSDGDLTQARRIVKSALLRDRQLLNALLDEVVTAAVDDRVRTSHRVSNGRIVNTHLGIFHNGNVGTYTKEPTRDQLAKTLLLDLVLINGQRLRKAQRPAVRAEATFHDKQARTMGMKATFFSTIAEVLPDDEIIVERVLTEDQLHEYLERAQAGWKDVSSGLRGPDDGVGIRSNRGAGVRRAAGMA